MADTVNQDTVLQICRVLAELQKGLDPGPIQRPDQVDAQTTQLVECVDGLVHTQVQANEYLRALGQGRLDVSSPRGNHLASPIKQLHAGLRHLTWQTQQIAKGDLSQNVDFLGDFSTAFNEMISALRDKQRLQKELEEAKQRAEDASRAKTEFLANTSHEIRTPLNAIIGMTELVLEMDLAAKQREMLMDVKSASQHLQGIINNILDISKIETNKIQLDAAPFKFSLLIEQLVNTYLPKAMKKGISFRHDPEATIPDNLVGDAARLKQVLFNLTDNAIKFTEKGEVFFQVGLGYEGPDTVLLDFCLQDTGIGISQEKKNEVFEPFTQEDASTTRKFGGAGLGLAISRELVRLMGGSLTLADTPGGGSTFYFQVRLQKADPAQAVSLDAAPATCATDTSDTACAIKVLVAEDVPLNQKLVTKIIEKLGHQAVVASDGQKAVEAFSQESFDLILMDIQMPEMDGLEATRHIRELEQNTGGRIPIIAVSAHSMGSDKQRCLDAGMDGYLTKPLQLDALRSTLNSVAAAAKG